MADIQKGYTFTNGETVTPAKLHALVDDATVADGTIANSNISASAAIAHSKLANIPAGQVLLGNASNVPTATALSGDVTVSSTGVTAIGAGVVVDADINPSASIAGTKIVPNFGSQNISTAGNGSFGSWIQSVGQVVANGAAGTFRFFACKSNNTSRWDLGATDDAENGSNSGTNFFLHAFADDGSFLERVLHVVRSTGNIGIGKNNPATKLDVNGSVTATNFAGPLTGNVTGNVTGSAATWATARSLSLTGDVTATLSSVNGSADVSAAATIANAAVTTAKLAAATQQSLVPVGAVMPFAMNYAPAGWLAANGAEVDRVGTYATLFAAIGTFYGAGNGSTTFNLPDLRGYFIRGFGTNSGDGTASAAFGVKQTAYAGSNTFYGYKDDGDTQGASSYRGEMTEFAVNGTPIFENFSTNNTGYTKTVDTTPGDTRPKNIALLYCIKF